MKKCLRGKQIVVGASRSLLTKSGQDARTTAAHQN